MSRARSRRELYSEATRTALLETASAMFAEHGYARTALDEIASATQVTRGAVYHHFESKQALFEAVLEQLENAMVERVLAVIAGQTDPWLMSLAALDAFLDECCEPAYGRLCWREAPLALGWERWTEFETEHGYGVIEQFVCAIAAGGVAEVPVTETATLLFHLLGSAGRMIAEAPDADRRRVRDTCADVLKRMLAGLRSQPPGSVT